MIPRREVNPDELRHLYIEEGWTMDQIAAHLGCGATTIKRRLMELGIPIRPRGPRLGRNRASHRDFEWSPNLAYAVGLITTDGNLSKDGRHLTLTSKDKDLLETARDCLGLKASITASFNPRFVYRLQWGDRQFYDWLLGLGLMPAKSLRLGALAIPDEHFADFVRGCIDGDGSIVVYTDRYNTFKSEKYVYERLFVRFTSASLPFLDWLQANMARFVGVSGGIFAHKPRAGTVPACWDLKYAKHDSIRLLKWIYYTPDVPCLARKRDKAVPFLPSGK